MALANELRTLLPGGGLVLVKTQGLAAGGAERGPAGPGLREGTAGQLPGAGSAPPCQTGTGARPAWPMAEQ